MMEQRKLQQVGGGTYTVSIPKAWATEHGLEAGNTVHLFTHSDGSMVVRSAAMDGENLDRVEVELDATGAEAVTRTLAAAEAVGFDTVSLVRDVPFTDEERRAVRELVRSLAGVELVTESDERLTVRNLLDAGDVSVRQSVVRLRFVALSIHREATAALVEADGAAGDRLRGRVDEAQRLAEMVARYFNRSLVSFSEVDHLDVDRPELFEYYATARRLESVATEGLTVARVAADLPAGPDASVASELRSAAETTQHLVDDATGLLLGGGGADGVHELRCRSVTAREELDAIERALFDSSVPAAEACGTVRALDALERTINAGEEIADLALRREIRTHGGL